MFENYQQERDRKKAVIALLMQMAGSDNKVGPFEDLFIRDVALQLDLVPGELEEIAEDPEKFVLIPPSAEQERMTILYYLLFTMRVDGQIHEKEEELCYKAGLRLGFNEYLTADLIRVMKDYLNEEVPPNVMLKQIKKYLN